MSVTLTPLNQVDADDAETINLSNQDWQDLTVDVPSVEPWNGHHDPICYTPENLRAIAAKHPKWAEALEWLAAEGGAELS